MYASFLAEYNEATFVVFKVIELVVVANDKHIAIATTNNMYPSVAGLQGIIVCPTTTNGWSPYQSNILAIGGEYRMIFTIRLIRPCELGSGYLVQVATIYVLYPKMFLITKSHTSTLWIYGYVPGTLAFVECKYFFYTVSVCLLPAV